MDIILKIAAELQITEKQVRQTITLLDEGATVPFIARYRKEATDGLDDSQLRLLTTRLQYFRELEARKKTVLKSIAEQDKLSSELEQKIAAIDNKTELEDLYLPYKPKRRTKAQIAKEAGLQPLADSILNNHSIALMAAATQYINPEKAIMDAQAALDGARYIIMEYFAEEADLIKQLRQALWQVAEVQTQVVAEKQTAALKYKDYFAFKEPLRQIPSHRALAILRARNEGLLHLQLNYQTEEMKTQVSYFESQIIDYFALYQQEPQAEQWLHDTVRLAWKNKLFISLELDALNRLKEQADRDAINIFAQNLKDLLLAPPAGRMVTLGLDPGIRTGVKLAVIDDTGKLLATDTIYPHPPKNDWQASLLILKQLVTKYQVKLIAIGNGTASRESEQLVIDLLREINDPTIHKLTVSEAGASVYSASELAANEFPDLDVSLRGAVSIARRLQDPLAELVKIEPKAIGVGQYQHDVNQIYLTQSLQDVVEDCVNAVGVDLNTASVALLSYVAGLNQTHANNIIQYRNQFGAFKSRKDLLKVARLGSKTFEQAAGFLRINQGREPLDASAVHPEAYPIVMKMLVDNGITAQQLIGNSAIIKSVNPKDYVTAHFGLPTVKDILQELEKPGRDPRGEFKTAHFAQTITTLTDLKPGMILEGVVTNVAQFGAFVDIGVHQDGLVHISALANQYVRDPRDVVKTGAIVKVKVLEIDLVRKRIALSMRLQDEPSVTKQVSQQNSNLKAKKGTTSMRTNSAMQEALLKLKT